MIINKLLSQLSMLNNYVLCSYEFVIHTVNFNCVNWLIVIKREKEKAFVQCVLYLMSSKERKCATHNSVSHKSIIDLIV